MGLIAGITNYLERARATALIVEMLKQANGLHGGNGIDPFPLADRLMQDIWELRGGMLGGKSCKKPHKTAVACYALAYGLKDAESQATPLMAISLMALLQLATENSGDAWHFHELDQQLLKEAARTAAVYEEKQREKAVAHWVEQGVCPVT